MILITGGAGFIGSALVWALNTQGRRDIVIVDDLGTSDAWRNLVALQYFDYVDKAVFLEEINTRRFSAPVDTIFHLGACSATTETDSTFLYHNNYRFSQNLMKWWQAVCPNARMIYASSAATYGDGTQGFFDTESLLSRLRPLNRYGYFKHQFDIWAQDSGLLDKMAGIKFFNVFGPNEYHKADMRSMICKAVDQIRQTGTLTLFKSYRPDYGDGMQKRDFVYIKDCVAVLLWLMAHPHVNGIFNLGCGTARTWNDLATAVFSAMDLPVQITYVDMPLSIRNQYQYFTEAPMAKLRESGYSRPFTALEEAVLEYVRHYLLDKRYLDAGV